MRTLLRGAVIFIAVVLAIAAVYVFRSRGPSSYRARFRRLAPRHDRCGDHVGAARGRKRSRPPSGPGCRLRAIGRRRRSASRDRVPRRDQRSHPWWRRPTMDALDRGTSQHVRCDTEPRVLHGCNHEGHSRRHPPRLRRPCGDDAGPGRVDEDRRRRPRPGDGPSRDGHAPQRHVRAGSRRTRRRPDRLDTDRRSPRTSHLQQRRPHRERRAHLRRRARTRRLRLRRPTPPRLPTGRPSPRSGGRPRSPRPETSMADDSVRSVTLAGTPTTDPVSTTSSSVPTTSPTSRQRCPRPGRRPGRGPTSRRHSTSAFGECVLQERRMWQETAGAGHSGRLQPCFS